MAVCEERDIRGGLVWGIGGRGVGWWLEVRGGGGGGGGGVAVDGRILRGIKV